MDFYKSQEPKVQEKIEFVLDLVRFEKQVPKKFFKSLENSDGIYEIRVITTFKSIRIFCFFERRIPLFDDVVLRATPAVVRKHRSAR